MIIDYLNLYISNLKCQDLKPSFFLKIIFLICVLILLSKKQILNVVIYNFRYTNLIIIRSKYFYFFLNLKNRGKVLTEISSIISHSSSPHLTYLTANLEPSFIFSLPLNHCISALGFDLTFDR